MSPIGDGKVAHKTRAERVAAGKAARQQVPLTGHAGFDPGAARDPVGHLLSQAESRVPELVPVRHGRMLVSPFTFYRGAALPMAADLATTASSGLRVQLCGDAHLANFGAFASPERRLIFDVNDFDETLPGPFEWDVKRLVASLAVAGRDNGFTKKDRRKVELAGAAAYRNAMRDFADQSVMSVWYAHLNVEEAMASVQAKIPAKRYKAAQKMVAKAHTRDSMQASGKLTEVVDGERRFIADPPLIVPIEDVFADVAVEALYRQLHQVVRGYRRTLQSDRRHLLEQFEMKRVARKVVGVGQRRHPRMGAAHGGRGRDRTTVPTGQGGPSLGARGVLRAQQVRQPGRASGGRPALDAGRERHLPGLGEGRRE